MRMELVLRFGYGRMIPWVHRLDGLLCAISGPDAVALWTPIHTRGEGMTTVAEFTVGAAEHVPFVLVWYSSNDAPPRPVDGRYAITATDPWWQRWPSMAPYQGAARAPVRPP